MSRFKQKNQELAANAFANYSITLAKALMVLLMVALAMLSTTIKTNDGIKLNAEYTIEVHWPDNSKSDVDTWLQLPDGGVVWYSSKEAGLATLERDDTGSNNSIIVNGVPITSTTRMEVISLRGIVPGEYILSCMLYRYSNDEPTPNLNPTQYEGNPYGEQGSPNVPQSNPVGKDLPNPLPFSVEIKKLNPRVELMYSTKKQFVFFRQELHIVRFTITADGKMENITTDLPASVVKKYYSPDSFIPPEGAF